MDGENASTYWCVCVCVRACMRAYVRACGRTSMRVHSCVGERLYISPVYECGFLTDTLSCYHRQHKHILRIMTSDKGGRDKSRRYQGNQLARQRRGVVDNEEKKAL